MTQGWHILRTRPHSELKLETAVQQIGVTAYVPKITQKRRHPFDRRQTITVRKAIYPSYAFVSEHFPVELITTTKLSAHWLKCYGRLAQISNDLIDLAEEGERMGTAIEEVLEALRMAPLTKRMVKRAPYSKDFKAVLGRAA